ncbi:probable mitochondrial 37S ribosomal protein S27 [Coccomyxa sp. Obi]|nr:probable mitochondrial 37S ribosomal protein S27 [Coccomyxa sp. Obi]
MLARRVVALWRRIAGNPVSSKLETCRAFTASQSTVASTQESLEEIRARIFGNHIGNGLRSGRKVLRKKLIGEKVASYYPEPISKLDPMFVDMDLERKKLKLDKLKRRGKAPPKKGQGKRASKKR